MLQFDLTVTTLGAIPRHQKTIFAQAHTHLEEYLVSLAYSPNGVIFHSSIPCLLGAAKPSSSYSTVLWDVWDSWTQRGLCHAGCGCCTRRRTARSGIPPRTRTLWIAKTHFNYNVGNNPPPAAWRTFAKTTALRLCVLRWFFNLSTRVATLHPPHVSNGCACRHL